MAIARRIEWSARLLPVALCMIAQACRDADTNAPASAATSRNLQAPVVRASNIIPSARVTSAEELALLARLDSVVPSGMSTSLRQTLLDPRTTRVKMSDNPKAQAIIDRIFALRSASSAVSSGPATTALG